MNKNLLRSILISTAIVLIYSYLIAPLSSFNKAKLKSMDIVKNFIYMISKPPKENANIVVVSIDRESLRNLNLQWPWGRGVFAEFISKLNEYGPRTIYLDFSLIGESDDKQQDDLLAQALSKAGNVLIPFYFDEKGKPLFPLQNFLEASAGFGPVNKLRDIDLSVRDIPLIYFSPEGRIIDYSIELLTACRYLGISLGDISLEKGNLIINMKGTKKKIPITKDGMLHISYLVTLKDINVIPFWKVLKEPLEPGIFKDKLVIVGILDRAFIDTYDTPLGISSGVEIITNTILTILSGEFIEYVSKDIDMPFLLCIAILITISVLYLPPWKGFFITILELCGYLILSVILSFYGYHSEIFSVCFLGIIVYIVTKISKFIYLLEDQNINLQKALNDLQIKEAELIESEKLAAMGRISAQLSHEINNPLCAIQNSINTIKYIVTHNEGVEKIKDISERISGELNRLIKLSRDILGFARPISEEVTSVDINTIINETINFYRGQLEEKKIEIFLSLDSALPRIKVSSDKLKQVFSNIILNAMEAMTERGKLTISTHKPDKNVIGILFADNGKGIPPDIRNKIFEPFFTTKEQGEGTGLGLFTVKNIVNNYGGTIDVDSATGKGATFKIKLPIR